MCFHSVWAHQGPIPAETEDRVKVEERGKVERVAELELLVLSEWGGARAECYWLLLIEIRDQWVDVVADGCFERIVGTFGGDD